MGIYIHIYIPYVKRRKCNIILRLMWNRVVVEEKRGTTETLKVDFQDKHSTINQTIFLKIL